jgi:citrate lyase beta subunit
MTAPIRTLLALPDPMLLQAAGMPEHVFSSGVDGVIIDLTDSLSDAVRLVEAFAAITAAAAISDRPPIYIRLPGLDHADAIPLLGTTIAAGIDGIVLTNATSGQDVTRLDARISVEEAMQTRAHGEIRILAEVAGTARAALALPTFRGASHRLKGLIWSPARLAGDLGLTSATRPNGQWLTPIAFVAGHCVIAADATGVPAILDSADLWTDRPVEERRLMAEADGFRASLIRL